MKIAKDLTFGILSSSIVAVISLAMVPFYVKNLGLEAYGLIGFYITLQAALKLLDMGLSPTVNREISRSMEINDNSASEIVHTFELAFFSISILIFCSIFILSNSIAHSWLDSNLKNSVLIHSIQLIGLNIAFRWPLGLYQGVLMGAEKITTSSIVTAVMTIIINLGSILLILFITNSIVLLFLWMALISAIHTLTMRYYANKSVQKDSGVKFNFQRIKSVWKFSAGLSVVLITGTIFLQADKLIISKLVPLDEFGMYMVAATLASGLYVLLGPIFNVVYPRMSRLVAAEKYEELESFYCRGTLFLNQILFPIAITGAFFSFEVISLWTGDEQIANRIHLIFSLLILGTMINGVMHFPYALQLAYGNSKIPMTINIILVFVFIPMLFVLVKEYGLLGGGVSWLVLNIIYFVIGWWITHTYLLRNIRLIWIMNSVLKPSIIALPVIYFGGLLIREFGNNDVIIIIFSMLLAMTAIIFSLSIIGESREFIRNLIEER